MLVIALAIQKPRGTVAEAIGADTVANDRLEMAEFMTTSARRDERAGASASAAETALRSRHCWPNTGYAQRRAQLAPPKRTHHITKRKCANDEHADLLRVMSGIRSTEKRLAAR